MLDLKSSKLAAILRSQGFIVSIVTIVVMVVISSMNPAFFSIANIYDILRLAIVNGMFSLAVLLVLVSGGIDVSFTAIANLVSFSIMSFISVEKLDLPPVLIFAVAIVLGTILGLVNGFFVAKIGITALIVTLGTASLYFGISAFFMGTIPVINYPPQMDAYSKFYISTVPTASGIGTSSLHFSIVILILMAVALELFLRRTTIGRGIYAIGGNARIAGRLGINVRRSLYVVYGMAGAISAIAGMTYASLTRVTGPITLQGSELVVIAGTVLGGVSIWGGGGSVHHALLGVLLLTIVQSSLVLVGIPNTWQLVAVGVVLIFGTVVPSYREHLRLRARGGARI